MPGGGVVGRRLGHDERLDVVCERIEGRREDAGRRENPRNDQLIPPEPSKFDGEIRCEERTLRAFAHPDGVPEITQ